MSYALFAASVAHEIRNPLAGIQMSLANLRHELQEPELSERIDTIVSEVERLGHLVNGIVDAARHQPERPTTTDVADLADELISLTRYQLPPHVELESRIRSPLKVRVPKERLRQALLNLILNAAAAIGGKPGGLKSPSTAMMQFFAYRFRMMDPDSPKNFFPPEFNPSGASRVAEPDWASPWCEDSSGTTRGRWKFATETGQTIAPVPG